VAALEKFHEHIEHRLRVMRIHRELRAIPIARRAQRAELFEDLAALFVAPLPDFFQKLFAAEIMAGLLLFAQLALDHGLRGNARVIGAGKPHGRLALEAGAADQDVLNRIVEHVAHREHPGDIRGRDDDRIGVFARVDLPGKRLRGLPGGIPLLLNVARFVALGDRGHGRNLAGQ